MLSSSTASTPRSSASASWSSVSTSSSILTRCPAWRRARSSAGAHPAGERDVVVLDQHRVVEAEAVVGAAAEPHRVLFEDAQPGRRLAGADDPGLVPAIASTNARVAVATPEMRQRRLSAVRSAASTGRARPLMRATGSPRATRPPSAHSRSICERRVEQLEGEERRVEPGEHARLARRDHRLDRRVGRHDRVGRDVAGPAQILEQRGADDRLGSAAASSAAYRRVRGFRHRRADPVIHPRRRRAKARMPAPTAIPRFSRCVSLSSCSAHRQHALDGAARAARRSPGRPSLRASSFRARGGSSAG